MKHILAAATLVAATLLSMATARAADFGVTPMMDGDSFIGCLAQNNRTGIGYLAVGDKLALFANADAFAITKGERVKGTWSVDGAAAAEFSSTADSDKTVTIDVPNDAPTVTALTSGKELTVTANGIDVILPLTGTEQAFTELLTCMKENGGE
ncbi:hypothetical protein [Rhizobium sp. AN80A]|uniref:hypothetical protein n=1 Tax=Rhizobium sp. AN80A TaxID=3040673 RepID=UPI0024B33348|nr:hypothetical protein [Rhizobium sp. AN80A]